MPRTRHVIAMTLVATALCADRMASAAPVLRAPAESPLGINGLPQMARQLAGRFCRVVPPVRLHQALREGRTCLDWSEPAPVQPVSTVRRDFSPFQFRLPPPMG